MAPLRLRLLRWLGPLAEVRHRKELAAQRRARALSGSDGGRTPAVALTAYAQIQDRTRALLEGFQLHIAKPVEPAELVAAVANLGGRSPARPGEASS